MNSRLVLEIGDLTQYSVDAIVNAAHESLLGGGGVDGAIHTAAGPELLEACRPLGGCQPGEAKITDGFRLPARKVIHTVGPRWRGGGSGEDEILASCYRRSLALACAHQLTTVAFPAIGTGVFRFPPDRAAKISLRAVVDFLDSEAGESLKRVTMVYFRAETVTVAEQALAELEIQR